VEVFGISAIAFNCAAPRAVPAGIEAGVFQTSVGVTGLVGLLAVPPEFEPEQPNNGKAMPMHAINNLLT
jgi:hypothetical protein